jgi:diaminopimelate epimerase
VKFTKMQALGNNYIYVSLFDEKNLNEREFPALARAVAEVRTGIGSDGLILIGPSDVADVRMRIFNADGSEAENCGNGLRCVAKYAYEHGYVNAKTFQIEVQTGVVTATVQDVSANVYGVTHVTVDMGEVQFGPQAVDYAGSGDAVAASGDAVRIESDGTVYEGMLVSVGNPHFVSFVDDAVTHPVEKVGPRIEQHLAFPQRINVEFVTPRGRDALDFRVWERGSGITYACGTGACAAVAAGVRRGLLNEAVTVHLLGGDLHIRMEGPRVWMTGPAVTVCTGDFVWPPMAEHGATHGHLLMSKQTQEEQ